MKKETDGHRLTDPHGSKPCTEGPVAQSRPIRVGDYAVITRRYSFASVLVSKVTAKQIQASGEWSSRDHTYYLTDVVFSGSEAAALWLTERLRSSHALCNDEINNAHSRRKAREEKLIAEATAKSEAQ